MSAHTLDHGGCRLAYDVVGEGPPVLFIQGVGVHRGGWSPQVEALSSEFRCLSFDNRGMGRSQPLTLPLTVEQMADDARALLDCQGWESAHVVAHSLGGPIALELALSAPGRVRSLSLLCTVARGRDATRLSRRMLWLGLRSSIGTRRMRRRAFLEIVMPPGAVVASQAEELAARLAPLFGHDLAEQPPVAMRQLGALRAYDAGGRADAGRQRHARSHRTAAIRTGAGGRGAGRQLRRGERCLARSDDPARGADQHAAEGAPHASGGAASRLSPHRVQQAGSAARRPCLADCRLARRPRTADPEA